MKITINYSDDKWSADHDGRQYMEVEVIDDAGVNRQDLYMSFYDGEPEDGNLARGFNDLYKLPELINAILNMKGKTLKVFHEDH